VFTIFVRFLSFTKKTGFGITLYMGILHVFNTILYENEFQNPQIFQQTISLFPEQSTLVISRIILTLIIFISTESFHQNVGQIVQSDQERFLVFNPFKFGLFLLSDDSVDTNH
jgi:hypothetical protein